MYTIMLNSAKHDIFPAHKKKSLQDIHFAKVNCQSTDKAALICRLI